jgi:hypothetical protein
MRSIRHRWSFCDQLIILRLLRKETSGNQFESALLHYYLETIITDLCIGINHKTSNTTIILLVFQID